MTGAFCKNTRECMASQKGKYSNPADIDQSLYDNAPEQGLSMAKYAAHRKAAELVGASYQTVKRACDIGNIKKNKHGKFYPKIADMQWYNNTDPGSNPNINRTPPSSTPPVPNNTNIIDIPDGLIPEYGESRARNEFAKARLTELKVHEQEGTLVNKTEAYAEIFNMYRIIRDRLLVLPVSLSPMVLGKENLSDIEHIIEERIRVVLEELSDEGRKLNEIED